jgi:two-component system, OmpR family, phosphate regulon sensor histidine kinase PhoR
VKQSRLYAWLGGISLLLLALITIQFVWIKDAARAEAKEKELRVMQALKDTERNLLEANTCFEYFTKAYLTTNEGIYMLRQTWDGKQYNGAPDTVDLFYDYALYSSSPNPAAPFKFTDFRARGPVQAEISIKFHLYLDEDTTPFMQERHLINNTTKQTFRTANYNQRPIEQILDMSIIDSILGAELKKQNIHNTYAFAFTDAINNKVEYTKRTYDQANNRPYQAALFEGHKFLKPYVISVFLKDEAGGYKSRGWLLFSAGVILLLIFSFYSFIRMYLRQVKLWEMRSDFIQNLTHEFNTPMANIALAVETLHEHKAVQDTKLDKVLKIISAESFRLRENIERALQTVTIEKGTLQLRKENVDLTAMVYTVLSSYQLQCEQLGGNISYHHSKTAMVFGDETHLLNCLCNLLDNAIKYRKDKPEIKITLEEKDSQVVLSIADNGIGMTAATQKHIFEKFYRAHQGNVHNTKGFGLGLTYVKSIIEAHGGSINVWSKPGAGSKFTIVLPKAM